MAWVLATPITKASAVNIAIRFMVISNALVEDATSSEEYTTLARVESAAHSGTVINETSEHPHLGRVDPGNFAPSLSQIRT